MGSVLKDEHAAVQFLKWSDLYLTEKPFQMFLDPSQMSSDAKDKCTVNLSFEEKTLFIRDIRGRQETFDLDRNGFTIAKFEDGASCLRDQEITQELVGTKLSAAVERLLRENVGEVDRIKLFDWRLRTADTSYHDSKTTIDLANLADKLKPANFAHSDQTDLASINHVLKKLPDEAEQLLKGRFRIINLWLPLNNPVENWPLALCDGSTVSRDDLIDTDIVRMNYQGGNLYILHRDEHEWHYLDRQQLDEVLIFKQFDTADIPARVCPHASFQQKDVDERACRPRESIEIRVLVFTNPE